MQTSSTRRFRVLDSSRRLAVLFLVAAFQGGAFQYGALNARAAQNIALETNNSWTQQLRSPQVQRAALSLSRRAVAQFLQNGSTLRVPQNIPAALKQRAGVFVTVEKHGQITPRGCRGTLQPITNTLAQEIVRNSVAACIRDATQPKLRRDELAQCRISLTVVIRVQPISSIAQHDANRNGLIAQNGSRIGVVLPYEGHDAQTQLAWARRKAAIKTNESAQLSELFAVRFRE